MKLLDILGRQTRPRAEKHRWRLSQLMGHELAQHVNQTKGPSLPLRTWESRLAQTHWGRTRMCPNSVGRQPGTQATTIDAEDPLVTVAPSQPLSDLHGGRRRAGRVHRSSQVNHTNRRHLWPQKTRIVFKGLQRFMLSQECPASAWYTSRCRIALPRLPLLLGFAIITAATLQLSTGKTMRTVRGGGVACCS